jgi:hypothetical protein
MRDEMTSTQHPVYRAEMSTAPAGVIAIIECDDMKTLRKQIVAEFIPLLDDGDSIQIFEYYRN